MLVALFATTTLLLSCFTENQPLLRFTIRQHLKYIYSQMRSSCLTQFHKCSEHASFSLCGFQPSHPSNWKIACLNEIAPHDSFLPFQIFPFSIVFNNAMTITYTGRTLRTLYCQQSMIGNDIRGYFKLRRPRMIFSWENVSVQNKQNHNLRTSLPKIKSLFSFLRWRPMGGSLRAGGSDKSDHQRSGNEPADPWAVVAKLSVLVWWPSTIEGLRKYINSCQNLTRILFSH